jgi:D-glycero-D-manno-heptose 1,7-bisphosphate phosphatase
MKPGIFLDRDGVINANRADHVKSWEEFEFLPGAVDALRRLARLDRPIIVVTNQAVIGRGQVPAETVDDIHARMRAAVRRAGGRVDDILVCSHRPEDHCACRKPMPGLIFQAAERWGLDLGRSVMVGDALTDVMAARAAGCAPILVKTGRGEKQLAQLDAAAFEHLPVLANLGEAADLIERETIYGSGHAVHRAEPILPGRYDAHFASAYAKAG